MVKGKGKVATAEFEYPRNRTGKTRHEVSLAKANADEVVREKETMAADVEAARVKEAKAAECAAKADVKGKIKISNAARSADSPPRDKPPPGTGSGGVGS